MPYEQVDERIKEANREAAAENIRTLELFGIFLETPIMERDLEAEKELRALQALTRTFRAEATYKVTSGKWYFEFEVNPIFGCKFDILLAKFYLFIE